jgi:hypothetical protein
VTTLDGLNADFRDVVLALCDAGAEFLIVGAYAVSFHGHPRATGDLDILVRPSPENARRVFAALSRFGAPLTALGIVEADLARADVVCQIGQAPRRIDILTSISGIEFEAAWQTKVAAAWRGRTAWFLGLAALLANKRATARPKDLEDVRALERGKK